jgi:ADP-ribose pyrophosphatase YjhB (NUDIX family)
MNNRFKMIASGYLFLIKDNSILLSRRFQTGYRDGMYSLPAGHIEDNERMSDGTVREIQEEIGLKIAPEDLKLVHVMHRKEDDIRMDFFFVVEEWSGEPTNKEPEKCDDLRWFPMSSLPKNTIPYIAAAIDKYQHGEIYSEFGWV